MHADIEKWTEIGLCGEKTLILMIINKFCHMPAMIIIST